MDIGARLRAAVDALDAQEPTDVKEDYARLMRRYEAMTPDEREAAARAAEDLVKQLEPWDDGTCGDCAEGRCHGGPADHCGCARHDASQPDADS